MIGLLAVTSFGMGQQKNYRLPAVDLKERIIWGSVAEGADGFALAFGGQDQDADDGPPHTRIREDGEWKSIYERLNRDNRLKDSYSQIREYSRKLKDNIAVLRQYYLNDDRSDRRKQEFNR